MDFFFFSGFDIVFTIIFMIMFIIFIGAFIFVLVRGIGTWNKNNHSPRLTVDATIVTKRIKQTYSSGMHDNGISSTSTWYYVTFQVESGDRMELAVSGMEYGMLAEGDRGKLSFQGTRYLGFQREI